MTTRQPLPKDVLNLEHLIGKRVHVKFQGGREVEGVLKGFDQLVNLVLEEAIEHFPKGNRKLGMTICRGTNVMLVSPEDGYEEIQNPFLTQEDDE